jgi:hypothetical protein
MKKNRLLWILTASSVQVPTLYSFRYLLHEPGLDYIPVLGGSWLLWRTSGSGSLRIFRIVPVLVSALVSVLEIWPSSHFSSHFSWTKLLSPLKKLSWKLSCSGSRTGSSRVQFWFQNRIHLKPSSNSSSQKSDPTLVRFWKWRF